MNGVFCCTHNKDVKGSAEMTFDLKAMMEEKNLKVKETVKEKKVEPIREYDAEGNLTYFRNSDGKEYRKEYDARGNLTYFRNSDGYECWEEYDAEDNITHFRNSDGYERWYDSEGNILKNNNGEWAYNGEELEVGK